MDISDFAKQFPDKMKEASDYLKSDACKITMSEMAIQHFEDSFEKQGFTDEQPEPWAEVERRKPESPWYGHISSKQQKYFSQARTTAKILTGSSGALSKSFGSELTATGVKIFNSSPYAAVHQFGGMAKIYGKKAFKMIARPFVGHSKLMKREIEEELARNVVKILKP